MNDKQFEEARRLRECIGYIEAKLSDFYRDDDNAWKPAHAIHLKTTAHGCLSGGIHIEQFHKDKPEKNAIVTRLERAIIAELEAIKLEYTERFEQL